MNILITGGAGYIGSHTVARLLQEGHKVTILDNFSNANRAVLDVLKKNFGEFDVLETDIRDFSALKSSLTGKNFDAVIHFAALIEVGRSVKETANFFDNNVNGSQNLFRVLEEIGVKKVIFSSSAAVYGTPASTPILETANLSNENPYATSKLVVEKLLEDYCKYADFKGISLRFFNPAGSMNGIIGESHKNESHLIPRLLQSIINPDFKFTVYGNDYSTPDGSAIRDYIHILDLVDIHIKAMEYLDKTNVYDVFNVGTGRGNSVFEVIKTAEQVIGKKVNYNVVERRAGDSAILVAGVDKIKKEMGWEAKFGLKEIVESAWEWIKK
jgi:UDP-glucose 4-epimerase